MKLILNILGKLWGIAIFSFVGLQFYKSSGNEIPEVVKNYLNNVELAIFSFLGSGWFFVVFIFGWFGVSYSLARISGWQELATKYQCSSDFSSTLSFSSYSGLIGEVRHKGVLKLATDKKGVYLKVLFPFRFGHKNLFIPWYDIESVNSVSDSNELKLNFKRYPEQQFYIYNFNGFESIPAGLLK